MKLGTVMKEFRRLSGLSSTEMHERTKFSRSYISAVENNKTNISTSVLEQYAEVCGVRPSQILKIQEDSEEFSLDDRTVKANIVKTLYPSD